MNKGFIKIIDTGLLNPVLQYIDEKIQNGEDFDILTLIKPVRVTLLLETNRLQSLYLCELLESYSVQSQRYCRYDSDIEKNTIFTNSELFSKDEKYKINEIINKSTQLYLDMTQLKPGHENKTKYTEDDFLYNIPIDDGRYILPMVYKCNTEMTVDGEGFLKLLKLLKEHRGIFGNMYETLLSYNIPSYFEMSPIRVAPVDFFNHIIGERCDWDCNVRLIENEDAVNPMQKSGAGALICTTSDQSVEEVFESKSIEQFTKITERVAYGTKHTSITEHSSVMFTTMCSVACYNQFIRHRHQEALREEFDFEFIINNYIPFIFPESITNSEFNIRVMTLLTDMRELIEILYNNTFISNSELEIMNQNKRLDAISQILPMGYQLRVIWSSNLSNEIYKASKRTCMKAQWEIRHITHEILSLMQKYTIHENELLLSDAKPGCCNGKGCPEGKFRCKDNREVFKLFGGHNE